jgi:hypothetical protein
VGDHLTAKNNSNLFRADFEQAEGRHLADAALSQDVENRLDRTLVLQGGEQLGYPTIGDRQIDRNAHRPPDDRCPVSGGVGEALSHS